MLSVVNRPCMVSVIMLNFGMLNVIVLSVWGATDIDLNILILKVKKVNPPGPML